MYNYKIVVADDETVICSGIAKLIERECPDSQIAGIFYNGADVIEYLKHNPVDIVIADIQMPLATGLDIAKYIHEKNLPTSLIIITGYSNFEYARQALLYRAYTILLKPVDPDALLDNIEQVKAEIARHQEQAVGEARKFVMEHGLKRQSFSMLLAGLMTAEDLIAADGCHFEGALPLEKRRCALMTFVPLNTGDGSDASVWKDIGEITLDRYEAYFIRCDSGHATFVLLMQTDDCDTAEEYALEYENEVLKAAAAFHGLECECEYTVYDSVRDLYDKYRSTLENIYWYYADQNDSVSCRTLFQYIVNNLPLGKQREFAAGILEKLCEENEYTERKAELDGISDRDGMLHYLSELHRLAAERKNFDRTKVDKIQKYIQQHYMEDCSLIVVADAFSLNPSYLSRLFKNNVGEKFVDYVSAIRINRAKELLRECKLSIKEIVNEVGFTNEKYFGQAFKKRTGMTPKQYRINNHMQEEK